MKAKTEISSNMLEQILVSLIGEGRLRRRIDCVGWRSGSQSSGPRSPSADLTEAEEEEEEEEELAKIDDLDIANSA